MSKDEKPDEKKQEKVGTAESPNPSDEKEESRQWLSAIAKAEKIRDQTPQFVNAKRFIDEFQGKWDFLQSGVSIPLIPINLVFAYVKTEIARLYFRDPWITVNPKRVEDVGAAKIAEQIINYTWGELDLKRQIKLALLDALLVGHGWIKVGYTAEFGTSESRPKEARGRGRPKKEETIVDTNEFIKSENAFAYHIPYTSVVFDPSATWPAAHTARWFAIKTTKPIRAIKESGIYKNTDKIKPAEFDDKPEPGKDKDVKVATLWEVYDLDHNKLNTVSPGVEGYLREMEIPDYIGDGFPIVEFSFNPVPGQVYPLSDVAPGEPQIIEMIKMQAIELNHLKRWNRQVFIKPGLMTDENKTAFKNSVDGAVIEVQGNPATDYFIPPYAPVQQDIYSVWNQLSDIYKNVQGQTELDRGANARAGTRTLGELRLALQGGRARADEKVDVLEDSISEVARKLLTIMQKKYDLPKIARIVGDKEMQKAVLLSRPSAQPANALGAQSFTSDNGFSWNKEDIHGDMDVDVMAGSTMPMDRESQIEIMEKLIPSLGLMGVAPGSMSSMAYGRELLRLIDLKKVESVFDMAEEEAKSRPNIPPKMMEIQAKMQAKQQETQVKVQAKQQETQMKAEEEQMKMAAIKAKTEAEIIKAKLSVEKAQHDMQKSVMQQLLSSVRGNGNGGKHGE